MTELEKKAQKKAERIATDFVNPKQLMSFYKKGFKDAKRWIPISEKMPEKYVSVLATDGKQILQGFIESDSNNVFCVGEYDVLNDCTHWQPLPSTDSINLK